MRGDPEMRRWTDAGAVVVAPHGTLDATAYRAVRDYLIKAGVDGPRAVIVDLAGLTIETGGALSLFAAVHTRLERWPGVPVLLVARTPEHQRLVEGARTARYVPVHASVAAAVEAIDDPPPRRLASVELPGSVRSLRVARRFVRDTCAAWLIEDVAVDATLIVEELLANAITHTCSDPRLRLELRRGVFSAAVYDDTPGEVSLIDPAASGTAVHGLLLVAQLSRIWGSSPTSSGGKVVWATLRTGWPVNGPIGSERRYRSSGERPTE